MKKLLTFIILSIFLLGACEKEKTADKFEAYRDAFEKVCEDFSFDKSILKEQIEEKSGILSLNKGKNSILISADKELVFFQKEEIFEKPKEKVAIYGKKEDLNFDLGDLKDKGYVEKEKDVLDRSKFLFIDENSEKDPDFYNFVIGENSEIINDFLTTTIISNKKGEIVLFSRYDQGTRENSKNIKFGDFSDEKIKEAVFSAGISRDEDYIINKIITDRRQVVKTTKDEKLVDGPNFIAVIRADSKNKTIFLDGKTLRIIEKRAH
ncbi:hypothetical protein VLK81_03670 [Citroniella saccharovorans]|uniref:Lipoprotein n=1 Tax=Citroniella saccharovorans TaxID=2053367 RepID=A0AAW9MX86_9FIRM|nr:hypothetical protein [Citroniella saccharovorans]MEB3429127.1 hypothetical protein [Citroniella saccharovorans]